MGFQDKILTPKEKAELALQSIGVQKKDGEEISAKTKGLAALRMVDTGATIKPAPPTTKMVKDIGRGGTVSDREVPLSREEMLQTRGFDVDAEGGTTPQRLAGRFGELSDVKNALAAGTDAKPEDFEVVNVEGIGFVFKGPQDEKFRALDPSGVDVGDVAVEGLDLLPTAAEGVTAFFTKNPTATAAVGASVRAAILATLKQFGVVENPDIIADSLTEGALSLAGAKIPAIGKGLKKKFGVEGRALSAIEASAPKEAFETGTKKVEKIATEVEKVGGKKPEFTVGEALSSVEPEKAVKLTEAEKAAGGLLEAQRSKRLATEGLKERFERSAAEGVEEVGEKIKVTQEQRVTKAIQQAETNAAEQVKRVNAKLNKISGNTNPEEIRSVLDDGLESVKKAIKASYDAVESQAREAQVDLAGIKDLSKIMLDKVRFGAVGKSIFKDSKKFAKDFDAAIKSEGDLDAYRTLQEARSEVRATIRGLREAKGSGVQIKEAKALEKEMTATINQALEDIDPKLAEQLVETDTLFAKVKTDIDKGLVGELLAKKGGQAKVPSENIVKKILGNSSNTKAILKAGDDFPELNVKEQLRDAFFTGYRKEVLSGKVTHDAYVKQIKDTGELIFSKGELKALESAGSAKTQITNILKRKQDRINAINKSFQTELSKMEPVELVKKVSKSQSDTAKLKKILSPQEWKDYQSARRAKAVQDMKNNKGEITLSGVDKVLKGSRGEMNLSLGEDYVKDLETAKDFLTVLAKKQSVDFGARAVSAGVSEADVVKAALFGPLSHTGFVIGRLNRFTRDKTQKAMQKMLNDPALLRERIRINNLPENQQLKQLQEFWGGLGVPLALNRGTDIEETSLEDFDKRNK